VLVIAKDEQELYRKNIAILISNALREQDTASKASQKQIITDQNENLDLCYLLKNVRGWKDPATGEFEIDWADFYLFVKER